MSITEIIDFLVDLMTNDDTRREFDGDPEATLASRGMSGLTAQDVRDARLMMADDGVVCPRPGSDGGSDGGGGSGGGGGGGWWSDPVREIRHTTNTFEIDQSHTEINQSVLDLEIDDRDTTIVDSFNGDTSTEVIAIQDNDVANTELDVVNIEDSFNEGDGSERRESPIEEPDLDDSDDRMGIPEGEEHTEPIPEPVTEPVTEPIPEPAEDVEDEAGFDTEPVLG